MDYDVIIIGAGPAGLTCGLQLAKAGKSCLIIEQREELRGKVCGDGLSSHCMQVLKKINIQEDELVSLGGKRYTEILLRILDSWNKDITAKVKNTKIMHLACQGMFLIRIYYIWRVWQEQVRLGWKVSKIEKYNSEYVIDSTFKTKKVVLACGAMGGKKLGVLRPENLPFGISARVFGDCNLASDAFYFKYDWQYGNGYAWLFPVGEKLWNYGVWSADKQKILITFLNSLSNA